MNYAKSLTMTGADGPIRVSVILGNRSGVSTAGGLAIDLVVVALRFAE